MPDNGVLFQPFDGPSRLDHGLPDGGAGFPDAGHDHVLDGRDVGPGGDSGAVEPPASDGGDAGPAHDEGAVRPPGAVAFWGFDTADELDHFEFFDWEVVSTREWHAADEHAPSGHFVLTIPFSGPSQQVQFRVTKDPPVDLSGHVVKIRLRQLGGAGPGGAEAFAQSDNPWVWTPGQWYELTELSDFTVASFNFDYAITPSEVARYGLHVNSSSSGGADNTHTLVVDSFWLE